MQGAANAKWRARIVPTDVNAGRPRATSPRPNSTWAELMRRGLAIDSLACPNACGLGRLRLVATIERPDVICRIPERDGPESPTYAALRQDADADAHAAVRFTGRVGLAQPAGDNLWNLALHTRQEGDEWRDPLYVLSVVEPGVSPEGGARRRCTAGSSASAPSDVTRCR